MALDREALFVALFARLQASLTPTVVYFTRRWESWDDTPPAQQPALLLLKGEEKCERHGMGLPLIWTLAAHVMVYAQDDGTGIGTPSTQLNQIMALIEGALEVQPGETAVGGATYYAQRDPNPAGTTLGGLCYSCEIAGTVDVFEGTQGHTGGLVIPLELIASA